MFRTTATHLAVLGVGLALGIGSVAIAQNQVTSQAASDAQIVSQLRQANSKLDRIGFAIAETNRKLDITNKGIGGYSTIAPLDNIVDSVKNVCRQVAQYPSSC